MSKTKDELRQEHHMISTGLSVAKAQHHADLTLQYAEQEATLFCDWIADHPLQLQPGRKNGEWIGLDLAYYTTTELFQLYKTQQTKTS